MVVELTNGAGKFELTIDKSSQVERVLAACGQDDASVAKAEQERQKAELVRLEEEKRKLQTDARDQIVRAIKESCRAFGTPAEFGRTNPSYYLDRTEVEREIAKLPTEMQMETAIDCIETAPDELNAFQSQLDAEYSYHARTGGTCTQEEFLEFARSLNSGITTSQVRNCGAQAEVSGEYVE